MPELAPLLCKCLRAPLVRPGGGLGPEVICLECLDLGWSQADGYTRAQAIAAWNDQVIERLCSRDTCDVYVPEHALPELPW